MMKKKLVSTLLSVVMAGTMTSASVFAHPETETAPNLLEPDWTLDQLVQQMRGNWLGSTITKAQMTGQVRDFYLHIEEIEHELLDGVKVKAWAYGLEGQPATVPGPTLRVKKGDLVRLHIRNASTQPHSLHSHGITSLDELNDGVPHITGNYIMPDASFTYEYVVKEAGTHWYHCHVQTSLHQDMGMYGALIVEDTKEPTWDKEFIEMVDEWDTNRGIENLTEKPNYNYFVVNGKAGLAVPDLVIDKGEIARVRLINAGFETHSLHLHGTHFLVAEKDGYPLPRPYSADTLNIAPGETYDVFIKGRDGSWPWHDHNSLAATDNGVYPGGMLMHVRGTGNDKFDPTQPAVAIPVEGHIHSPATEHTLLSHGDPLFLKERMDNNSKKWRTATKAEREHLHNANINLGRKLGAKYNRGTGKWVVPKMPSPYGTPYKPGNAASTPAKTAPAVKDNTQATMSHMKPPVLKDKAVTPLAAPLPAVPFNPVAPAQPTKGEVVNVTLSAQRATMEVAPGDVREVWTFNGSVPAPTIRVHQGDTVRITLENKDPEMAHGLDFHFAKMDMGTFHKPIEPGQSMTYEVKADFPGIFYFHCSADPVIMHIANGMFGALIVDPPGYVPTAKEFVLIQNEWYKNSTDLDELINGSPVAVAFNGVAAQYTTSPLTVKSGEDVRFYFVNAGINDFAAWHVIGQIFDEVYYDGNPKNKKSGVQTVTVGPGAVLITDIKAPADGSYLMLTHQMNEAMKGGAGLLKVGN